jgi:hypothetical protein
MAGKLIMLPLRIWLRSARLITHATGEVAGRAVSLAGQTLGARQQPDRRTEQPREAPASAAQTTTTETVVSARPSRREPPVPTAQVPVIPEPVPEPVHVSEEPELVRESAEPGAEDGAGAALTVIEPWSGYQRMNAREIIARAKRSGRAELAAVRLYEARHRARQTVLAAVDRQLKLA